MARTHLDLGFPAEPVDDGLVGVDLSLQRGVLGGVAVGFLRQRLHELVIWVRLCEGGAGWVRDAQGVEGGTKIRRCN